MQEKKNNTIFDFIKDFFTYDLRLYTPSNTIPNFSFSFEGDFIKSTSTALTGILDMTYENIFAHVATGATGATGASAAGAADDSINYLANNKNKIIDTIIENRKKTEVIPNKFTFSLKDILTLNKFYQDSPLNNGIFYLSVCNVLCLPGGTIIEDPVQIEFARQESIQYMNKYLKYKNKYLNLKKKLI